MTSSFTVSALSGAIFTHHPHPPHLFPTVTTLFFPSVSCRGCIVANIVSGWLGRAPLDVYKSYTKPFFSQYAYVPRL